MGQISTRVKKFHEHCITLGYYPSSLHNAFFFISLYVALGPDLFGLETYLRSFSQKNEVDLMRRAVAALLYWILLCTLRKLILRKLLTYRGCQSLLCDFMESVFRWMYEGGNPSFQTKLFVIILRLFCGWSRPISKSLYDLQGILPPLPLPPVDQTIKKHLLSMKPFLKPSQYAHLEEKAEEFIQGPASKFQRYLKLKWWLTPNYISDWWEEYVYLKARTPLLPSTSYYFVDTIDESIRDQATRAALIAYSALCTREAIANGTFETLMPQGLIPVCNWQYSRMFNTCRVPGEAKDYLRHDVTSDHIVVVYKGRYFNLPVYRQGTRNKLLSPPEFQLQFQRILADTSESVEGEDKLADLTTWDRTKWAEARRKYFSVGVNQTSLEVVESSAFFFHLDENEYRTELLEQTVKSTKGLIGLGKGAAYGEGGGRWMDKSLNFFVAKNGRAGGMVEHSWGDGMISSHMWEVNLKFCLNFNKLDSAGNFLTPVEIVPPYPPRLKWNLSEECLEAIELSSKQAIQSISDIDPDILVFSEFGKGGMKKCRVSPDAYIQMALQLAYYRDQGEFRQTYEPCMTRLYLQGRTETIRSCTEESCRWVLSMVNNSPPDLQKLYFKEACDNHQYNYREAMNGRGSDRHLFALYVVSKYLKTESPYLEEALSCTWPLSTSQLPIHQTKLKNVHCPAGGFFPVDKDGYGVAYIISGEDVVFFDINSRKSSPLTDSGRLGKNIHRAMLDIHELFFPKPVE